MLKIIKLSLCTATLLLMPIHNALSDVITFEFTGTINSSDNVNSSNLINAGDILIGRYSFDTTSVGTLYTQPNDQYLEFDAFDTQFSIAGNTFISQNSEILLNNRTSTTSNDMYIAGGSQITGPSLGNYAPHYWEVGVQLAPNMLAGIDSNTTLIDMPPPLDGGASFLLDFKNNYNQYERITANINSFQQVSAVPLPPAIWLFGSVALGFLGYRKKTAS